MHRRFSAFALSLVMSAGLVAHADAAAQKSRATATVMGLDGKPIGQVNFRATSQGVLVEINLKGLPPGVHALSINAAGKCDPKSRFASAGGHFSHNPKKQHGYMAKGGSHGGDLPNQVAAADGTLRASIVSNQFSIGTGKKSVFDKDGAAFVVHVRGDDYMSQPAGNSGDRLACGVLKRIGNPGRQAARKPVQVAQKVAKPK